ncbi:MAG TPA: lysophospholipid acyltransferase family protein [Planctomycetota bacterium]
MPVRLLTAGPLEYDPLERTIVRVGMASAFAGATDAQLDRWVEAWESEQATTAELHAHLAPDRPAGRTEGLQHLQALHASGRGAIVCTLRAGAWLAVALEAGRAGYHAQVLGSKTFLDAHGARFRSWTDALGVGLDLLPFENRATVLRLMRGLRSGKGLFALLDSNASVAGIAAGRERNAPLDFLGMPVLMRRGMAYLAAKTGAAIVPALNLVENGARVTRFLPPIEAPDRHSEAALAGTTRRVYAALEELVRAHPESWAGWSYLPLWWRDAPSPRVPAEAYQATLDRVREELRNGGEAPVSIDSRHTISFQLEGADAFLDGRHRRVLHADEPTLAVFEAVGAARSLGAVHAASGLDTEAFSVALTRLLLTGLVQADGFATAPR